MPARPPAHLLTAAQLCTNGCRCTSSRALYAMAQLRMLPPSLSRLHTEFGTPYVAVLVNAFMIAVATTLLQFDSLIELSMFFYSVTHCPLDRKQPWPPRLLPGRQC